MDIKMEKVVDVYREIAAIPTILSCNIWKDEDSQYGLESVWQQRDLEREENIKYVKSCCFKIDGDIIKDVTQFPPKELTKELLVKYSSCGNMKAIVREVLDKNNKKVQYIEVWDKFKKILNINLKDIDKHGDVISNDQFGSLEWSKNGKKILYIAETKKPKTKSFFKSTSRKEDDCEPGNEHVMYDSWGEQMDGAHRPTVCILNLSNKEITVFSEVIPPDVSAGQAFWHHDCESVVFIGWMQKPYRLGLRYCPIRQCALYFLHTDKKNCKILSDDNQSVRSPRLHPNDNTIVFVENRVGGPHMQCSRLMSLSLPSWDDNSQVLPQQKVIIDLVKSSKSENDFPGLYFMNLPSNCWSIDCNYIFLASIWRSHTVALVVDLKSSQVKRLTSTGNTSVLDVKNDVIVVSHSTPTIPPELRIAKFEKDKDMNWTTVIQPCKPIDDMKWSVHSFKPELENSQYPDVDIEYILYQPMTPKANNRALVVFPHGGPHSNNSAGFLNSFVGMCKLGFTVVNINYRGSLGFGNDGVYSLPGRIGKQDVSDVHQVSKKLKEELGSTRVFVTGGSHGGFLSLHLISQFPDFYSATVVRNPVVNLALMSDSTDIPDWCYCECGTEFHFKTLPSTDSYSAMLGMSPIFHIEKAKAPVLLMLGDCDLRVPPSQGKGWAQKYRALGKECKVLLYKDNNHPLSKVDAEADGFVNTILWFQKYQNTLN
ncbi:acylamino-acid-releasing enzyme-like [Styela clava]